MGLTADVEVINKQTRSDGTELMQGSASEMIIKANQPRARAIVPHHRCYNK